MNGKIFIFFAIQHIGSFQNFQELENFFETTTRYNEIKQLYQNQGQNPVAEISIEEILNKGGLF